MNNGKDVRILRDLARQVAEIAARPVQDERRDLWRRHNSLRRTRPLLYMRGGVAVSEIVQAQIECEDPFYRAHEGGLRRQIFQESTGDDTIIEPWITQRASHVTPPDGPWGVPYGRTHSGEAVGAWKYDPPLKKLEDIERLVRPHHEINEEATA